MIAPRNDGPGAGEVCGEKSRPRGGARDGRRAWGGSEDGGSQPILSELLGKAAGEPLQDEVSAVRVLFELLGFSLRQFSVFSHFYLIRMRRRLIFQS